MRDGVYNAPALFETSYRYSEKQHDLIEIDRVESPPLACRRRAACERPGRGRVRASPSTAAGAEGTVDGQVPFPRSARGNGRPADDAGREDLRCCTGAAGSRPRAPSRTAARASSRACRGSGCRPFSWPIRRSACAAAAERGRYATLLPSTIAAAATWDLNLAYEYGEVIGRELRDQQYQVVAGRRREPHARAAQRTELRVPRRRPDPRRQDGRAAREGPAEPEGHRGRQALRLQRPGDRAEHRQREDEQAHHARDRPARLRDRRPGRPARHGDVLLQQGQRRLGLRERLPAQPAAEEDLGLQGRRGVRLERHAQHRQGRAGRVGLRAARRSCPNGRGSATR